MHKWGVSKQFSFQNALQQIFNLFFTGFSGRFIGKWENHSPAISQNFRNVQHLVAMVRDIEFLLMLMRWIISKEISWIADGNSWQEYRAVYRFVWSWMPSNLWKRVAGNILRLSSLLIEEFCGPSMLLAVYLQYRRDSSSRQESCFFCLFLL